MSEFGFSFDASACERCGGKCCTGESGYIWIDESEIAALAVKFEISPAELKRTYLDKIGAKFSVKEKPFEGGLSCVFFDEAQRNCGIYELRPKQCRSFPFWEYFKTHTKELEEECIGVRFLAEF